MPRRRNQELLRSVGKRIRQLRLDREMTQADLAEEVDLTVEFIGRIESGAASLSLANLAEVARALEVSLPELLDVEKAVPKAKTKPGEARLLRLFRKLGERDQGVVVGVAELLAPTA